MIGQRLFVAGLAFGLVLGSGGAARADDADLTCEATGKGTGWSLGVNGPSVPVGGYVAGYPDGTITGFSIDGFPGQPDTTGLPPGTSNGLFTQIPAGTDVVLQVITSSPPGGPFTVAFINQGQTGYGPAFSCPFASGPGSGGDGFSVAVADFNADGTPDLVVNAPGAGTFFVEQSFPGRSGIADRAKTALVAPAKAVVKKAGKVTIALRATTAGRAALAKDGRFTVRMKVTFKGKDGTASSETVKVTFKNS
ncbi:MAG: FG-GAP repeat protein [Actinomycetota bacterium]|nr:FG-GAP repeat protein [Actinomycetota bacterium]